MRQIITFYSYKGGVGRSMALANIAALLARWGYKTLIVDWDLEAPGLENFFKPYVDLKGVEEQQGVVDILAGISQEETTARDQKLPWRDFLYSFKLPQSREPIHLLTAGRRDASYFGKVRDFDVQAFYLEKEGGYALERLRTAWLEAGYDFVLIDSRTGVTDTGGICTIQFPDILVLLFTPTNQGLAGTLEVARQATLAQQDLPFDRLKLLTLPIASRFDVDIGFELAQEWLRRSAEELAELYADWLPRHVRKLDVLAVAKLPYKAHFSFGEKLAVVEENTIAPDSLAYAYVTLAALLANKLEHVDALVDRRDDFVRMASKTETRVPEPVEKQPVLEESMLEGHRRWLLTEGTEGTRLSLRDARLRAVNLTGAVLRRARLRGADLSAANLAGADLAGADLRGANLQGAILEEAVLEDAMLEEASLIDALLPGGPESYRLNLYIAVTLGAIRPHWEGTPEQIDQITALIKTPNYKDATFKNAVDRAIANYQPAGRSSRITTGRDVQ